MSRHWNPDDDLARARKARAKSAWPEGATAGLLMVAAACIGAAAILYRIAGPRDIVVP